MDSTSLRLTDRARSATGNRPVRPADEENLLDAVDTDDADNALPVDGASDSSPRMRTQEPKKSFFSFLNRTEHPEDALVKREAKQFGQYLPKLIKLEQDLGNILKELQALNKVLQAATTDGNRTALETAASKVEFDLEALRSNVSNTGQNAPDAQSTSATPNQRKLQESLTKDWTAYNTLYAATRNRSKQIEDQHAALSQKKRMCNQVGPVAVHRASGAEDDSDSYCSFSEGDLEDAN